MAFEPGLEVREVEGIEPGAVRIRELANEGKDRDVGMADPVAEKLALVCKLGV